MRYAWINTGADSNERESGLIKGGKHMLAKPVVENRTAHLAHQNINWEYVFVGGR